MNQKARTAIRLMTIPLAPVFAGATGYALGAIQGSIGDVATLAGGLAICLNTFIRNDKSYTQRSYPFAIAYCAAAIVPLLGAVVAASETTLTPYLQHFDRDTAHGVLLGLSSMAYVFWLGRQESSSQDPGMTRQRAPQIHPVGG